MRSSELWDDNEFMAHIKEIDSEELIEHLEWYGVDPYYRELWSCVLGEVKRRLLGDARAVIK